MKFFLTTFHPRPILRNTMNSKGRKIHEFVFFHLFLCRHLNARKKELSKGKLFAGARKKDEEKKC